MIDIVLLAAAVLGLVICTRHTHLNDDISEICIEVPNVCVLREMKMCRSLFLFCLLECRASNNVQSVILWYSVRLFWIDFLPV